MCETSPTHAKAPCLFSTLNFDAEMSKKKRMRNKNGLKDYERVVTGLNRSLVKEGAKKRDAETQSEVKVKVNGSKCCSFVCIGEIA